MDATYSRRSGWWLVYVEASIADGVFSSGLSVVMKLITSNESRLY